MARQRKQAVPSGAQRGKVVSLAHGRRERAIQATSAPDVLQLTAPMRGEATAADWLDFLARIETARARVERLTPYQAHRVGYMAGGVQVLEYIETLLDTHGVDIGTTLASVRAYWEGDVARWANGPTQSGQEIIPMHRDTT